MGVSVEHAQSLLKRMPDSDAWDERDSQLQAQAAVADLDAAASLDATDIADLSESGDPKGDLKALLAEHSRNRLRAQIAANARWAKTPEAERRHSMDAAREAFDARFEREVDPDGVLDQAERTRRAAHARKAYFARLALKSAQARRRRQ
jgi:hypothetical protein